MTFDHSLKPLPEDVVPLLGDNFENVDEQDKAITLINGKQLMTKKAFEYCEFLDLNETDVIYGSTFEKMIKEAFRSDKNFIVAKLKSRATDKFETTEKVYSAKYEDKEEWESLFKQEGQEILSYFNAYSIIKLMFKKKNDEYVGRFHEKHSISAMNPLTNSVSYNSF
jgi:hypothetical protein